MDQIKDNHKENVSVNSEEILNEVLKKISNTNSVMFNKLEADEDSLKAMRSSLASLGSTVKTLKKLVIIFAIVFVFACIAISVYSIQTYKQTSASLKKNIDGNMNELSKQLDLISSSVDDDRPQKALLIFYSDDFKKEDLTSKAQIETALDSGGIIRLGETNLVYFWDNILDGSYAEIIEHIDDEGGEMLLVYYLATKGWTLIDEGEYGALFVR